MASPWHWYAVKTLYRFEVEGKPHMPNKHYSRNRTMFEERVILVRARSFDDALKRGEKDAKAYAANGNHENPFGQKVSFDYLNVADAYLLSDEPGSGVEVYSRTGFVPARLTNSALVNAHFGEKETHKGQRTQFLDAEFSGRDWWKRPRKSQKKFQSPVRGS